MSKVVGTKAYKNKIQARAETLEKVNDLAQIVSFYANREWVFDSSSMNKLNAFLIDSHERKEFCVEVQRINWPLYSKNLGYGIKRYILGEEAAVPSHGYADVVQRMKQKTSGFAPWSEIQGRPVVIRSRDQMKKIIMSKDSVQ